ncbi:MAG: cyclic nucleotide-binding domain-containing protein [Deltaproteobacteria bacterium]|nr:cyclic nucleotide-binding domain-containing protein [Deltaproteobacteria bacterium]
MKAMGLSQIPLFASLPENEVVRLLSIMKLVSVAEGTLLIQEGDPGDRFYLVIDGQLEVIKAFGTQDERFLDNLEPGDVFGEMSLFDPDGLRVASVRAKTAANLYEMTHADFRSLIHRWPTVAYEIARILSQRLCSSHDKAIRDLQEKNRQLSQACHELQQAQGMIIEKEQNLRCLMAQVLTAQEQEQRRISRELHDEIGQSLLVLRLQVRRIEQKLGNDQAETREECLEVLANLNKFVEDVRRLSRDLSPTIIEDLGLSIALQHLIKEFAQQHDLQTDIDLMPNLDGLLPREAQVNIYRIFQESLTNIGKYAQASNLTVAVTRNGGMVSFLLADNGKGFHLAEVAGRPLADRGMGLRTMDERVRMMGGILEMKSQPGRGTEILFSIPV